MKIRTLITSLFLTTIAMPLFANPTVMSEIQQLAREKQRLTMEQTKLFHSQQLFNDKAFQELQMKLHQANKAYAEKRRNHPQLVELFKKSKVAQKAMIKAKANGDKAASNKATSDYTKARIEIEQKSATITELTEARKPVLEAGQALKAKQKELLLATSEGKEFNKKIEALENKMAELRQKMIKK